MSPAPVSVLMCALLLGAPAQPGGAPPCPASPAPQSPDPVGADHSSVSITPENSAHGHGFAGLVHAVGPQDSTGTTGAEDSVHSSGPTDAARSGEPLRSDAPVGSGAPADSGRTAPPTAPERCAEPSPAPASPEPSRPARESPRDATDAPPPVSETVVYRTAAAPTPTGTALRIVGNVSTGILAVLCVVVPVLRLSVGWPRFPVPYEGQRRRGSGDGRR
ncbi:hypothetical protein [Nocardiopsis akebiae]|uniref:hypothetical protein n=1 Tax=Nocardiopsis akebiae TaxID=2831968 RepID=UPI0020169BC1|nr:hypothetical protein [Nocardiopsis akebiae]